MQNNYMPNNRINKNQIVQHVIRTAESMYNVRISNVTYIEEVPECIKHSCPLTGVAILLREISLIHLGFTSIEIPFFVCRVCGKLYIYKNYEG